MKIIAKLLLFSCLFISLVYSDDVYIRNGQILKNCHVIDTTNAKVKIIVSGKERLFPLVSIDKVILSPYNQNNLSIVQNQDGSFQNIDTVKVLSREDVQPIVIAPKIYNQEVNVTYPNIYLLPLSFIALGLAWDYFEDVSQLNQSIDFYKKYNGDTSDLESARTRKTILGITFIAAGVLNTVFALKTVEIKASSNSLSLVYRF